MSFDLIVQRNIRDEFYDRRSMKRAKKILLLSRRLSYRPKPSDIQNNNKLPLDLKKADSKYYKLYGYILISPRAE